MATAGEATSLAAALHEQIRGTAIGPDDWLAAASVSVGEAAVFGVEPCQAIVHDN